MPNYGPPTQLTPAKLRVFATSLRELANEVDAKAEQIQSLREDNAWVFGASTALKAIRQIRNYIKQIGESVDALSMGEPFTSQSRKSNHGVVTPSLDESEAKMVAEVHAEFERDINRSVAKQQPKKPSSRKKASG